MKLSLSALLSWRPFQTLSSDAEAAFVSKFCRFSLATLEITCSPDNINMALVEQEHPDAWRWAVFGPEGFMVDGGSEPTREHAKQAVEQALLTEVACATAVSNG